MMGTEAPSHWLQELPRHWAALPLGYRYGIQLGKMLDGKKFTGKHRAPYLRNVDVQWGRINLDDLPEMDFDEGDRARFSLRLGDVLVCEGGELGRAAVWHGELSECYYQKALHRLRPINTGECPQFLFYSLQAAANEGAFTGGTGTTTIEHLPAERLRKIRFPFPPEHEQRLIASFLDEATARIDKVIEKSGGPAAMKVATSGSLLALLREYRAALITNAVTGKIDVRGAALTEEAA